MIDFIIPEYTPEENTSRIFGVFNWPRLFIIWAVFCRVIFLSFCCYFWRYIFYITSSDSYSSWRLESKFKLFILVSIAGELIWLSVDFGNLPEENTEVGYLGRGSLNYPSEVPLFVKEEAHIIPNRTAKQKYPLLCIDVELSLFKIRDSWDSFVPSDVPDVLF